MDFKQKNQGIASARNKGIELAKFDWIAILDHDDYFASNKLEIQIKSFLDPVFQNKIFDRYEETLKDIEKRIKQADSIKDKSATLQMLRLKTPILKDQ